MYMSIAQAKIRQRNSVQQRLNQVHVCVQAIQKKSKLSGNPFSLKKIHKHI